VFSAIFSDANSLQVNENSLRVLKYSANREFNSNQSSKEREIERETSTHQLLISALIDEVYTLPIAN
jgi:hypothetical protein